jgi:5-methylcytosine-specific restriction endonuclease McrA
MPYTEDQLDDFYYSTDGYCRYCGKKISRINYGSPEEIGAWVIDHVNPKNSRGSNEDHNLVPACYRCNSKKHKKTLLRWCRFLKNSEYSEDIKLFEKIIKNCKKYRDDICYIIRQVRDE